MEQAHASLVAAGLQNVVVALGEPKHAQRYCPSLAPSAQCLCSPDNAAYKAFGARRGQGGQLLGVQVIAKSVTAMAQGHTQGESTGDVTMLGGTFVIDGQGQLRYVHYDRFAGDHAPLAEVLQVMKH